MEELLSSLSRHSGIGHIADALSTSWPPSRSRRTSSVVVRKLQASSTANEILGNGSIELLCAQSGLKMTGQRRIIARVLSASTDHPDVEELYRRAAELDSRISVATVYRTVRLLEEKGILNRRDFGSGRARYEPNDHGQHYHLIDVDTGKVTEFRNAEHEKLIRTIAEELGFEFVSLRLEIFGRHRAELSPVRKEEAS